MKNLEGRKIEIKDLFTRENFYRVPEYQRPFSWDDDNFNDLIQDLLDAEKGQEYFLGTLVLHKKDELFDIVDGQQRLTTIMILFACLRDLLNDSKYKESIQEKIIQKANVVDGIPERIRVEVRDREIFNEMIVTKNGTTVDKDEKRLPEPQWRYVKAIKIFNGRLKAFSQDDLQKFIQFLSQNCMMISLSTTTFDDAFKLFTIVNDRGKQLRRIDILKAKNIAPDIIRSERVRTSLAQKWEEWEKNLGEDTFEDVFYLLRFILLEEKPYSDLLVEYEEKIFKKGLVQKGQKFIDTICDYSKLYSEIFDDFTYFDEHPNKNRIISLLFIMKSEFKSYEWKACLLQYLMKFGEENLEVFLSRLELKYLEGWILSLNKDSRTIVFGNIVKSINAAKDSSQAIEPGAFKVDLKEMTKTCSGSIYGRTWSKYILLRLELLATEHDVEKKIEAKSIEHVLPQTFDDNSEWSKWFNDDEREEWSNKLANLVLLSKSKNSAAKNYNFGEKKKRYLEKRVSDYPRSIQVLGYDSWTPDILDKRETELLNLVFKNIFE